MSKLIYINEEGNKIIFRENISNDEIDEFLQIQSNLKKVMTSIDYYNIVRENILELMQGIINYNFSEKKGFATINRYLFNMLSSFYSYVKFYERFYCDKYKNIFSEQFDTYETYIIISELRKYTTHCYLAITKSTLDITTGKVSIQIVPEELLKNDSNSLRKDMKEILKRKIDKNETIDLRVLTSDFLNIFSELQVKIMDKMKHDIFKDIDCLEKFIFGKNMNKKESYILKDNGDILNTSNIFYLFFNKFKNEYNPSKEIIDTLKKMHDIF